ncbi:GntR family transcriptional regulator [Microvirga massiliensis]|uniref:GntR family transcriptional regulator n=1 Tax=Microvirga massiliensis TaxID=1033741 RepID=UPI000660F8ED|nr:GntR family transcriptional regulator [Microvirga massiliensis]
MNRGIEVTEIQNTQLDALRFGARVDVAGTFFNSFAGTKGIKTLPEQLAEKLVELIISGALEPGQRLHEASLAERFGVSRGPIREALRLLEPEGLVTMTSRRGASVAKLSRRRLHDIFSVRAALMGLCAEELAQKRSALIQEVLDEGTRRLFTAHEAGDVGEYIIIVYQVSMYLAEAAGNEIARSILFSLGRQTLSLSRRVFDDPNHRLAWARNWQAIVESIRVGDPVRSRQAVCDLIDNIKTAALEVHGRLERETLGTTD